MSNATEQLVSVGGIAQRTGCAPSTIKFWESRGEIPASIRVTGDNRRVWTEADVTLIEAHAAARRRQHQGPEAA